MRLFLFAAIICAVLALICVIAPTTIGIGALGWFVASFLAYLLDVAFGPIRVKGSPPTP
jgi:hypothetical protein